MSFRTKFIDLGLFSPLGESPIENILLEIPMMNLCLKIERQSMREKLSKAQCYSYVSKKEMMWNLYVNLQDTYPALSKPATQL